MPEVPRKRAVPRRAPRTRLNTQFGEVRPLEEKDSRPVRTPERCQELVGGISSSQWEFSSGLCWSLQSSSDEGQTRARFCSQVDRWRGGLRLNCRIRLAFP